MYSFVYLQEKVTIFLQSRTSKAYTVKSAI